MLSSVIHLFVKYFPKKGQKFVENLKSVKINLQVWVLEVNQPDSSNHLFKIYKCGLFTFIAVTLAINIEFVFLLRIEG